MICTERECWINKINRTHETDVGEKINIDKEINESKV